MAPDLVSSVGNGQHKMFNRVKWEASVCKHNALCEPSETVSSQVIAWQKEMQEEHQSKEIICIITSVNDLLDDY